MVPRTWQWASMGLPATVSVPAAIELAAVIVVLAKLKPASEAQLPKVAPVAAPRIGNVSTGVVEAPELVFPELLPAVDVPVAEAGDKKPPLPPPPQAVSKEATTTSDSDAGVFKNVSFDACKQRHLVSLVNYME